MMSLRRYAIFLVLAWPAADAGAAIITLYDDGVAQLPEDQGWFGFASTSGASPQLVSGGTRINTGTGGTSPADEAGWFNKLPGPFGLYSTVNSAFPVLDTATGFSLSFELQIHAETHTGDRAGFSVILLDDNALGVEIGFWEEQVWAQGDTPLFTHAESQTFDTTASEILYELTIQGAGYTLSGNGSTLLSGGLRDYSDYLTGSFTPDPYEIPSFVFLGDDTDSAFADFTLGTVALNDSLQLPPPPVWSMLLPGLAAIGRLRRRAQRT